ncbi:MAG: ABC transporter permease [Acidimicrobiales bacterium]|nr:ABC transporter permease [Acidimicrobiales bacterium]
MRPEVVIAQNDLRRGLRNRSAVITAFVGPLVLATIISFAFGANAEGFRATIGVVDADASELGSSIARGLTGADGPGGESPVTFTVIGSESAARTRVDDGDIAAAIVIPAGFGASITGGRPLDLTVLTRPDEQVSAEVARAVAGDIANRLQATRLAVATAAASTGASPTAAQLEAWAAAAQDQAAAITVVDVSPGRGEVSFTAYFGASMAIVFLFLAVGAGARSLIVERRDGTLARELAAPITPRTVLAGKTLAVFVLGLLAMVTMWLVTTVVFGARWGDPVAVVVVAAATVFAIAGVSTLVTALARTEAQADALAAAVTFTLALLGGNFVQPGALPDVLRRLSLATPNGWALRAFTDLSADEAGLVEVLPAIGVLAAIGAVTLTLGLSRLGRLVATG